MGSIPTAGIGLATILHGAGLPLDNKTRYAIFSKAENRTRKKDPKLVKALKISRDEIRTTEKGV